MAFTIRGILLGRETSITVHDDGTLEAEGDTLYDVTELAKLYDGTAVGPWNGPKTLREHLTSPLSAWHLLPELVDELRERSGDPPVVPPDSDSRDDIVLDGLREEGFPMPQPKGGHR
jgi:hypothetical protein